ncbi:MAG: cell division protein FtsA [Prevotella sp.]|jgi:cell division protein FtsA|nr:MULTISPECIES: cell division protein FtsA [unclassified Prevotella]MCH3969805.1 cell division protein FtsA [Prevotella sp.]MCH3984765.1 cell division protein FtsA [Prevotella sp.]MCH3992600.1 cell division protein FtsA [Prevotella sp.]MCH4019219.1 cell division protein FtsA [Prevotella sp.]MCH4099192.1 cell division protein FtsA [Prevotella sp.]
MPKEFIVAIELGSSKMTGIAGQKNLDGSITVLSVVEEKSESCIRKGVVYNMEKTGQALTNIIKNLRSNLKQEITHVYVGVGGQSIHSEKNVIIKDLPENTQVTQEMINEKMDENRNMSYPEQEILDAITQEYKVDNQFQLDPVGIQCNRLEGNFLNILWRKKFYNSLNTCFDNAGIAIAEMYLAPLALADNVLTETEKRSGCVLIDLGAETTTVSIYFKGLLRFLTVIPLGSNNITKDLTSLQIEESQAEKLKLKYACAYTDNKDIKDGAFYQIDKDRKVDSRKFIEIVEARVEEIVENVWFQIPNEYTDKLLGGMILTGGGSNMPNIETAFRQFTHIDKIRIAKFVIPTIHSNDLKINAHDGTMNTILSLLAKGDMNCAGEELRNDLFNNSSNTENKQGISADRRQKFRDPKVTTGSGIVLTAAEKQEMEEARRKKEAEEEAAREAAEEEERQRAEERKENSWGHKFLKKLKKFGQNMISEDE